MVDISQSLKDQLKGNAHFETGRREEDTLKDNIKEELAVQYENSRPSKILVAESKYKLRTVKHTCFEVLRIFEVDIEKVKCLYCGEVI